MKPTEARILIFIQNCNPNFNFGKQIAYKLKIDYGHCMRLLSDMRQRRWISAYKEEQRVHYELSKTAPIDKALALLK